MGFGKGAGSDHLISISAEEAFDAYEAVRHRLPISTGNASRAEKVETLADIADRFDVFLLDAFGVLNIGETAIPGACVRVESLKAAGKRVLVVSNAASLPETELLKKYNRLGFSFVLEDIVTSRATLAAAMPDKKGTRWGVMAASSAQLDDLGDMRFCVLEDDPQGFQLVDGFILIGSASWTEHRQLMLEDALSERPRPVLVANPDIVAPRETGFSAEPGHFAHRLADLTGVTPEFFGKPFRNIFDLAFERLGPVDKSRVVMVGDSLHTDILGAQAAGVSSALMANFGFFAGHDIERAVAASGIVPDFIVERP
jgi:glycerol 3-phosphatase-2